VVLDPPRKGLDERSLKALVESDIQRIVYVSCNPNSLARDMELLATAYKPLHATPVDMFPRTEHVETVAVFQRKGPSLG
jgi:tRNA/tmRNA/rRNA uracil-C5-methylase (TrmA/RlmC/RlmD family)